MYIVETAKKEKNAALLGIRVGLTFLIASAFLVFVAYFVLTENFQTLLTDYSFRLVRSMIDQGVMTVEYELLVSREQTAALADAFIVPEQGEKAVFPKVHSQSAVLRTVYVTGQGTIASDGRSRDLSGREDIVEAFAGRTAVYGPYFNEEKEYVVCYSAPVIRDGSIVGVLSVEKDGYYFCSLISGIRFGDTGECYIINQEGTDIAVSDQNHIEWVNDQYNARKLLEEREDPIVRAILELEQKGLDGESGIGTYYWEDGLVYLVYSPISSVNWVLLGGLREEEVISMTHSALYASILESPILSVCTVVFLLLTVVSVFWIVSSLQKSHEMNKGLKIIANYDALTGTMNRNSYHTALDTIGDGEYSSLACIYIDVNGLHEINNYLGHQAGDDMLRAVADSLQSSFSENDVYRIGGDEFVVLCRNQEEQEISRKLLRVRQALRDWGYEISAGTEWRNKDMDIKAMVRNAEEAMLKDKQRYYSENGKERQQRELNRELEKLLMEKRDADTFLSAVATEFKGVYFVNLDSDQVRHLYIPSYFEEILEEAKEVFSRALSLYCERMIDPEYQKEFQRYCDYDSLEPCLNAGELPDCVYRRKDGIWIRLRILKFKTYTEQNRETLWIFSEIND